MAKTEAGEGAFKTASQPQKEEHLAISRVSSAGGGADRRFQPVGDARHAAENAVTATLDTFNERITGGEAEHLAAQLPQEIRPAIEPKAEEAEGFSLEEFYRRVARREGVNVETARIDAPSVMRVLREAVTPDELDDVMAQLPADFDTFFR